MAKGVRRAVDASDLGDRSEEPRPTVVGEHVSAVAVGEEELSRVAILDERSELTDSLWLRVGICRFPASDFWAQV